MTRLLAAALAATVVLAACSGNGDEPTDGSTASVLPSGQPSGATADPSASASATAPAGPSPGATGTSPDAVPNPGATESPTPPPPSQPNPNPGGLEPTPIPTGTYRYATDGWSQLGTGPQEDLPDTTTLTVAAASGGVQDQTQDARDDDGYGQTVRRRIEYGDDGFLLHEVETDATVSLGPVLGDVEDNRLLRAIPPGALGTPNNDVGWTTAFTMSGDGVTANVTVELLRFEDVTIGGTTVRAAVVRQEVTFSGELEGKSTSTSWYRPEDLLPLKERSSSSVSSGFATSKSEYTSTLKSLTPS